MPHPIPGRLDLIEAENQFLKQTIFTLREELEKIQSDHDSATQILSNHYEKDKLQAQESINALRETLDSKNEEFNQEKQTLLRNADNSQKQSKAIIHQLRQELEKRILTTMKLHN